MDPENYKIVNSKPNVHHNYHAEKQSLGESSTNETFFEVQHAWIGNLCLSILKASV